MNLLQTELVAFWAALAGYSIATAVACWAFAFRKRPERTLLAFILLSCLLHTIAIAARWGRLGHLPVNNTFEMLSANIWGLMIAVLIGYWRLPRMRSFVVISLPVVMMLMAWMLLMQPEDSKLPPTYDTVWLFIHIAFIKLFLGCAFIALGLGVIVLLRGTGIGTARFSNLPPNESLDKTSYRCMALALIFDTLGIVAGAVWAQDAWGRFWSWDRLEIWSLLTWLSIGLTLHVRASFRTGAATNALLVIGTWLVAFFTFFGIPFVSSALHKGMI